MNGSANERRGRWATCVQIGAGLALLLGGSPTLAQDSPDKQPATATSSQPATAVATQPTATWLRVTAERVNLRSRGDVNSMIVTRVRRDAVLRAVGRDPYGWYRILPPEGVFSLVSAEYVDRLSPTEGVASTRSGKLRVRVGSLVRAVDPLRSEVQTLLERGTRVRIIGEQDDWLKIVPPTGVYLHVSAQHTQPISDAEAERLLRVRPETGEKIAASQPAANPKPGGVWGRRLEVVEEAITIEDEKPLLEQSWKKIQERLKEIAAQRDELLVARLAQAWIEQIQQVVEDQKDAREAESILQRSDLEREQHEREMERIRRKRTKPTSPPTTRPTRGTP